MKTPLAGFLAVALAWPAVAVSRTAAAGKDVVALATRSARVRTDAARIGLDELLVPGTAELRPSEKLLALEGKRVRLVGFMVRMELPPRGAFYLVPRPLSCDEAGGGTADLPPQTVRVIVPSAAGKQIAYNPRPLEVTGILETGNRIEGDGQASNIRLILDGPRRRPDRRKE
jgi:hypothetical protein